MSARYIQSLKYADPNTLKVSGLCISEEPHILVAAIDFGTTFSGYAFSFVNDQNNIRMNKSWGENFGFESYKTPTSVLVRPDGKFKAFGYEAEQMYSELVEENKREGHELYRHFKMILHRDGVSRRSKIKAISGKKCKAMDIFAMSLQYLKNHLLEAVATQIVTSLDENMIKWVITVPAIWTDEAKQFMREAACKAGLIDSINSQKLQIALEPEAASVYCKSLDVSHFVDGTTLKSVSFRAGTKYMVIDAGGGTIDITAYKVLPSGKLKEILAANGGPWGGTQVDQNFINLMKFVLGEEFIDHFQKDCPKQWLQFMTTFEKNKKVTKPGSESKIAIPLSWTMGCKYREVMHGKDVEQAIQEATGSGVTFMNGSLVLSEAAVNALFTPVISQIIDHISSIIRKPGLSACEYVLLVGGFGECKLLQHSIMKYFSNCKVLIPAEAQMSVIKGAVVFGNKPSHIHSRIARKTYGEEITTRFREGIHDPKYRFIAEGIGRCYNLFSVFVQQGEEIQVDKELEFTYCPLYSYQTGITASLYTLNRKASTLRPEYVDTPGFNKVGEFTVDMPDISGGRKRKVDTKIVFGGTEIHAYATDRTSGCTANTTIDFLTD